MGDSIIDYLEKQTTSTLIGILMYIHKNADQYSYATPIIIDILKKRNTPIPSDIMLPPDII